ncbi:MAG TPA: hypothetical protein P5186_25655 [Candidatus Paceibacterota bacterium]|nr:hypothetical protein [Verrucomicrobiota bacterium]HRY51446.1 hypothetical protein [Candidatus Paceibacterota bacterium]
MGGVLAGSVTGASRKTHGEKTSIAARPEGELVCVCVYKRGALEVIRQLANLASANQLQETPSAYKTALWIPKTLEID